MKFLKLFFPVLLFAITNTVRSQSLSCSKFYSNNPTLGGECIINKSSIAVENSVTLITFDVNVEDPGMYYASFWILPSQKEDGTFNSYDVSINNENFSSALVADKEDWQCLKMNSKIWLNKGANTICVKGRVPEIPEIEFVKVAKTSTEAMISSDKYDNNKKSIISTIESQPLASMTDEISVDTLTEENLSQALTRASSTTVNDPKYDYVYLDWVPLKYTFYKKLYFKKGQTISVSTSAQNNFQNVIELFSVTNPESYSWAALSSSGKGSLSQAAPIDGYYYVRVRSYLNGKDGIANVTINGNTYSNVQLFSIGYTCEIGTDQYYNTFTTDEASDPIMWMEGTGSPGAIIAYNDDYQEESDYDWGVSARIHKKLSKACKAVHISAYSSYKPEHGLKMYMRCKDSNIHSRFDKLKSNDAIASSPSSYIYNCISWSGGITSYWEWPGSALSDYYVEGDTLASFDKFYASNRYEGCATYTRTKATKDESVVDLWAVKTTNGYSYKHASIKEGADEHHHGYAWESKPGSLTRTFHPRFALEGDSYGKVVAYYIRNNASTSAISLDESLSENKSLLEHVDLSETELSIINNNIIDIPTNIKSQFEKKLSLWEDVCNKSIFSSPEDLKNCDEYKELLSLCKRYDALKYLAFSKLDDDDHYMVILIEDLLVSQNYNILNEIKNENASLTRSSNSQIVRTPLGNTVKFVKKLLGNTNDENSSVKYSNTDHVTVESTGNGKIAIGLSLEEPSTISIEVSDSNGALVSSTSKVKREKGRHTLPVSISGHGVFFVKCYVNGNINVKKIVL